MLVREANLLDLLPLLSLSTSYAQEAHTHDQFPIDLDYLSDNLMSSIVDNSSAVFIAHDKEPIGYLWTVCTTYPWSKAKIASDVILYVKKERRKSPAAVRLIRLYEAWAAAQGAVAIQLNVSSGIETEKTSKFYKKLGYASLGNNFRKEVLCPLK